MKFLLLAYGNEEKCKRLTRAEMRALGDKCAAYDDEMRRSGRVVSFGSLDWPAKTLRRKSGKLAVTDGPFLETKELVGGIIIIEAAGWDEAVELASLHPAARMGEELGWGIELRPMGVCELQAVAKQGC